ncbi:MAG: helix-turn-helix domain-containing protein [Christensenellaceae bacterium]|jgi:transcriptional regulator with XRE-family HTH domain|nr:helix-turn-helix domain-containing protein [Christensenellaceae bacterium]
MENYDKMAWIKILTSLMKERGLTQSALSKIIGIRQSQISNYLNGKSLPNYHYLRKLITELNLDANTLF